MRSLTIKKEKSFVGCFGKIKVYMEDATSRDIVINNVSYRKIGKVKNGEEKGFSINKNECNIVVIEDKISKNYCNEIYKVPAGEDDVFLSGKSIFDPAPFTAFRFNDVNDINVLQNRRKGLKKGIFILCIYIIIAVIVGLLIKISLLQFMRAPKQFSNEGMTLTLTNQFREKPLDGFTMYYYSKDVDVLVLKEEFSFIKGLEKITIEEYANVFITFNLNSSIKLQNKDGLTFFEYQNSDPESKEIYNYFSVVYKTSDSFWMVQFATLENNYLDNKQNIIDFAQNIQFSPSLLTEITPKKPISAYHCVHWFF